MPTPHSPRRLALVRTDDPRRAGVRRLRFARIIDDLGPVLSGKPVLPPKAAPAQGVRAP
jgi:hypothetical protein